MKRRSLGEAKSLSPSSKDEVERLRGKTLELIQHDPRALDRAAIVLTGWVHGNRFINQDYRKKRA